MRQFATDMFEKGKKGYVFTKESDEPFDMRFQPDGSLPLGGNPGDVLTKKSSSNYDVEWKKPEGGGAKLMNLTVSDVSSTVWAYCTLHGQTMGRDGSGDPNSLNVEYTHGDEILSNIASITMSNHLQTVTTLPVYAILLDHDDDNETNTYAIYPVNSSETISAQFTDEYTIYSTLIAADSVSFHKSGAGDGLKSLTFPLHEIPNMIVVTDSDDEGILNVSGPYTGGGNKWTGNVSLAFDVFLTEPEDDEEDDD